jgi:hypothetical protein
MKKNEEWPGGSELRRELKTLYAAHKKLKTQIEVNELETGRLVIEYSLRPEIASKIAKMKSESDSREPYEVISEVFGAF